MVAIILLISILKVLHWMMIIRKKTRQGKIVIPSINIQIAILSKGLIEKIKQSKLIMMI